MPDARSGAMGEVGVATRPDANSMAHNPAKLAFITATYGLALSYSPWLKSLVPDMYMGYLSAYVKPARNDAISVSMRYFSMGSIQYAGAEREDLGSYKPAQLAVDAAYARKLSDNFSIGTAFRYIYASDPSPQGVTVENRSAIRTVAADVSAFFTKPTELFGSKARLSAGFYLSNIGRQFRAGNNADTYELPANFKLGTAATFFRDKDNQFTFAVDLNELLVAVPYTNAVDGNSTRLARPMEKLNIGLGTE